MLETVTVGVAAPASGASTTAAATASMAAVNTLPKTERKPSTFPPVLPQLATVGCVVTPNQIGRRGV